MDEKLDSTDYLMHYGVLGMKWGVRKQKPPSGYSSGSHSSAPAQRNQNTQSSSGGSRNAFKEQIKQKLRESRAARKQNKVSKKEQKAIERAERKEERRLDKGRKNPSKLKEGDLDTLIRKMSKEVEVKRLERELKEANAKSVKPKNVNMNQSMNNIPPKKQSAGRRMVNEVLTNAGKTVLTTALIGAGTYALNYAGQKKQGNVSKPDWGVLADQMAPLKQQQKKVKVKKA